LFLIWFLKLPTIFCFSGSVAAAKWITLAGHCSSRLYEILMNCKARTSWSSTHVPSPLYQTNIIAVSTSSSIKLSAWHKWKFYAYPSRRKESAGKCPLKSLYYEGVCVWVFFAPHSWVRTHLLGATIYKKIPIELRHRWANVFRPIKSHPARALIMKNHIESTGSAHADSGRR